jgi:hypothetical protein
VARGHRAILARIVVGCARSVARNILDDCGGLRVLEELAGQGRIVDRGLSDYEAGCVSGGPGPGRRLQRRGSIRVQLLSPRRSPVSCA